MSLLDTKTKAKFTMLDSLVAVLNTIVAGYGLPLTIPQAPEVQDTTSLVVWGVQVFAMVAVYFAPTIITHLSVKKYVEVKAAQNIEGIKAGTTAPVQSTPVTPQPAPVVIPPEPSVPFDSAAFMKHTMGKVQPMYGELNDSTIYFTALSTYRNDWKFVGIQALRDCADLLVTLAKKAFKSIWEATYEEELTRPIKPEDCTRKNLEERAIAKSTGHYTALLWVIEAEDVRAKLN